MSISRGPFYLTYDHHHSRDMPEYVIEAVDRMQVSHHIGHRFDFKVVNLIMLSV